MSEEQLLSDIVAYLEKKNSTVAPDERESLELAIDCIRETFNLKPEAEAQDLLAIYERGTSSSAKPAESANSSSIKSTESAEPEKPAEVSDEIKAEADALKAKGNKLMATRDFSGAADAYTEAIAKNPGNPMYFSNRAAAYTHLSLNGKAVDDARRATELDPNYPKAWSRLGLALWAQGNIKESLEAYETGLKVEGDHPTEAMRRDYENVKRRYDEEVAKNPAAFADAVAKADAAVDSSTRDVDGADSSANSSANPSAGGGFDFGQLAGLMNNPQVQQMAKNLMSDPGALGSLMNSPMAQQMKEQFSNGKMPSMSDLGNMMNNPAVQDMMKNFQK